MLRRGLRQYRIIFASALVVSKPCGGFKIIAFAKYANQKGGGVGKGAELDFISFFP